MISINNLKVFRQERAIPTGTCMSEFHGQRFRNLKFKNSNKDIKDTFGDAWRCLTLPYRIAGITALPLIRVNGNRDDASGIRPSHD
jgi:hypothetical protein